MKHFISLIFSIFFSFLIFPAAFAQDVTDDWSGLIKDYSSNSNFGKIISEQEYNKAIQTKESFIKKNKKNKKKSGKSTENQLEEKPMLDVPDSPYPLLVLPVDVYYENKVIPQGFYLVNLKRDGEKYFLELSQGKNLPIAVIEAKGNVVPGKVSLKQQVSVENVGDKMIKINYSGDNLILESVLWIN